MATTHRGTLSVAGRRRPAMTAQAGNAGVLNAAIAAGPLKSQEFVDFVAGRPDTAW
jgi:hypothetical protein